MVEYRWNEDSSYKMRLLEAVIPETSATGCPGYFYTALLYDEADGAGNAAVLKEGMFHHSPFINFRWLKAPGEVYGRSPVMKALTGHQNGKQGRGAYFKKCFHFG